ncbi:MAG: V-type ATP synthase subunit I [Clostridia bacterium]|nr:V-type ATP synthase subunit I [Clostridia bacterium]
MAIVKMRKLHLIAMSYDKDAVLNALQRTAAAEVTLHTETESTVPLVFEDEELRNYLLSVENALESLAKAVADRLSAKAELLKDGFDVTYSEFLSAKERQSEVDELVAKITALTDEKNRLKGELAKLVKQKETAEIYAFLNLPFIVYAATANTRCRMGFLPATAKDALLNALSETELCGVQVLNETTNGTVLCVVCHKDATSETDGILSTYGFTDCPYSGEKSGAQIYGELCEKIRQTQTALTENEEGLFSLKDNVRLLKVYCEYLAFALEKKMTDEKLRATESTFLLQAYVPEPSEELVKTELQNASGAVFMEFSDPTEEDEPPTLLQNNSLVANFEGITNTYSAPNYREFDPNTVMAFFYSLFMGFIIGDAGYGLLMLLIGGYLWWKYRARPTGMSRLAGAFAIGGVFAVIWGLLFNSVFGFAVLPATAQVIPSAQDFSVMWSFVGIRVPPVLIIAMVTGITQLFAGYLCKAFQCWRRGRFWDGVCEGVLWAIFSVGVALAIVGLTEEANLPVLATVGGITAGVSLALAILTAGRHEKFFGKFTKGFGAAYGIINYASDILSYARLYGLMLAGAVIAGIIAQYGGGFVVSGNPLMAALGIFLLVAGNLFNLVISLLGAYIHDARLQYVEFYGRFYEGDGELFKPLGSERKYIYLVPEKQAAKKD